MPTLRSRTDRCPGVFRPWPADDGALVRVRLIGGRISSTALAALSQVAREYGDGNLHLTSRANLQLRALPSTDGQLDAAVVAAIAATGLVPSASHELVRNVMVSPLTGLSGGLADLRPAAASLDSLILSSAALAGLPGRFLFVLDDGRGDLVGMSCDLGLIALDSSECQLRIGEGWGPVVPLAEAPRALVELAEEFQSVRGTGPDAPWHVSELGSKGGGFEARFARTSTTDLTMVEVRGAPATSLETTGTLDVVDIPDGVLTPALVDELSGRADELVVTPWHGIVVPT